MRRINALSTRFWCEQVQILFHIKDFDVKVEKYIKVYWKYLYLVFVHCNAINSHEMSIGVHGC